MGVIFRLSFRPPTPAKLRKLVLPLKFTGKVYPRTLEQNIRLHRLRSGRCGGSTQTIDDLRDQLDQERAQERRRKRRGQLRLRMVQVDGKATHAESWPALPWL
jgi:hypothetical protein